VPAFNSIPPTTIAQLPAGLIVPVHPSRFVARSAPVFPSVVAWWITFFFPLRVLPCSPWLESLLFLPSDNPSFHIQERMTLFSPTSGSTSFSLGPDFSSPGGRNFFSPRPTQRIHNLFCLWLFQSKAHSEHPFGQQFLAPTIACLFDSFSVFLVAYSFSLLLSQAQIFKLLFPLSTVSSPSSKPSERSRRPTPCVETPVRMNFSPRFFLQIHHMQPHRLFPLIFIKGGLSFSYNRRV